jgi:hypothetical protein
MILVKITDSSTVDLKPCPMCQHIIDKYKTRRVISFVFEK